MMTRTERGERRGRGRGALGALLALGALGACGPSEPDAEGVEAALAPGVAVAPQAYDPTNPPGTNGLGLFVVAGSNSNYCLSNDQGSLAFCPERFVTGPWGVKIEFRSTTDPNSVYSVPVTASRKLSSDAPWRPVELRALRAVGTELMLEYKLDGVPYPPVTGAALASFKLEIRHPHGAPFDYELKIEPPTPPPVPPPVPNPSPPSWLRRYNVSYRVIPAGAAPTSWARHCSVDGIARRASFVGKTKVDGLFGTVDRDENVTTMSCETGSIDTCLAWGYAPWATPALASDESARYLFGTCLQAKRAAYFAGPSGGAYRKSSFTLNGTPLVVRDTAGILSGPDPAYLEAVWSPQGAVCLNRENLRVPEFRSIVPYASWLPSCPPGDWRALGAFATGRVGPPPP
jgi:ADYC domain